MKDRYGRTIDYIRVALTDTCNLRCWYCVGREDPSAACAAQKLTHQEYFRILRIAVNSLGIRKIRLTGGEPLLYPQLEDMIVNLLDLPGLEELAITTNGLLLQEKAAMLRRSGIHRVNVSLEGATEQAYFNNTGRSCLRQILVGLDALLEAGFDKPKLNVVLCRDFQLEELQQLLAIGQQYACELRFIELMGHFDQNYPSVDEMVAALKLLGPLRQQNGCGTATHRYRIEGYDIVIGIIPSRTHSFCSQCRRLRLTSDGHLRTCLYTREGVDLKPILRSANSDIILADTLRKTVLDKPLSGENSQIRMIEIGG